MGLQLLNYALRPSGASRAFLCFFFAAVAFDPSWDSSCLSTSVARQGRRVFLSFCWQRLFATRHGTRVAALGFFRETPTPCLPSLEPA